MLSQAPRYYESDPAFAGDSAAAGATACTVPLSELRVRTPGVIETVEDVGNHDVIAARLRELGFVRGEPVSVAARGPFGGDPLLIQIGYTRFALRRAEAARVHVVPATS